MYPTTQRAKKQKQKQNKTFHYSNVPPKLPVNYSVTLCTKKDKNTLVKYLEKNTKNIKTLKTQFNLI
jgi:hypothetical protein